MLRRYWSAILRYSNYSFFVLLSYNIESLADVFIVLILSGSQLRDKECLSHKLRDILHADISNCWISR